MAKKARTKQTKRKKTTKSVKLAPKQVVKQTPKVEPVTHSLSSSFRLFYRALRLLKDHWKLFLGIALVYALLTIVLVRGIGGGINLTSLKANLKLGFKGRYSGLATGTVLFSYLLGSTGSSSTASGGTYQTLLILIVSLATIWALRQVIAGKQIRVRDGFYQGIYPLIPFILVLLVVGLQLLPLTIGGWLYGTVVGNSLAVTLLEKVLWGALFLGLATISLYMLCSSVFALYIVTLPDMTPMKALRSARQLVRHRRWTVLRRILFLPFALLVLGALIVIPLVLFVTPLAVWVFFALSMLVLLVVHSYMYSLYRELL